MDLALALLLTTLGSVGAVVGAAGVLVAGRRHKLAIELLVAYATGTLLGAALLKMLPTAWERKEGLQVPSMLLAGLLLFFVLERLFIWRHHHAGHPDAHASSELILVGDAIHNLMDGVAIGIAFAEQTALGVSVGIAVLAHEVPQEVGDFAILLDGGMPARRAFILNIASSLTSIPAVVVTYIAADQIDAAVPAILAIAAASFFYIALADLVPRHHASLRAHALTYQLPLILLGVGTIALFAL